MAEVDVVTIDWLLPAAGGVAAAVWVIAFVRLWRRMVATMGSGYAFSLAVMVMLAIAAPVVGEVFPHSWLWNATRGALMAVLLIIGTALATEGMGGTRR